jgi:hypothetical protein
MNASKVISGIHHGAYALKNIQKEFPRHIKSPSYLSSGPIGPVVVNNGHFPNRRVGPMYVAPQLREAAWIGRRSSILAMGTARVSMVRFRSTHLNTLSTSLAGGPPMIIGLVTVVGTASGRGRHLVLEKSVDALVPHLYITDT